MKELAILQWKVKRERLRGGVGDERPRALAGVVVSRPAIVGHQDRVLHDARPSDWPWTLRSAFPVGGRRRRERPAIEPPRPDGAVTAGEERAARAARVEAAFRTPVIVAALLTLPALILEATAPPAPWQTVAFALNAAIWLVFLAELVAITATSRSLTWARRNPIDVAIVVLTPPVMPATLQGLRFLRLLRLVRLLKLAQVLHGITPLQGAKYAAGVVAFIVVTGGAAFAYIEPDQHLSVTDGIWWALTTVTTVGYGDIAPKTDPGRALGAVVMLSGIGTVALITAAMTQRFVRRDTQEEQRDEVVPRLEAVEREVRALRELLEDQRRGASSTRSGETSRKVRERG